ncbi:hypothetical protein [Xenorhabdus japonica]|uniref:Uncharacterized protein n=1 Tax=Xenorhabdus japonica TaxID=53341 RepID=A0A1I5ANF6_9GAMM|nr:hypothetical protein [Xenorhabdus japonica]SFN63958.1 hypothetical protein SAMN05421579_11333 [Xenorhabdus japonica]
MLDFNHTKNIDYQNESNWIVLKGTSKQKYQCYLICKNKEEDIKVIPHINKDKKKTITLENRLVVKNRYMRKLVNYIKTIAKKIIAK